MMPVGRDIRAVGPEDQANAKLGDSPGGVARELLDARRHVLIENGWIDDLRVESRGERADGRGRVDLYAETLGFPGDGAGRRGDGCRRDERCGDRSDRAGSRGQEAAFVRSCRATDTVALEAAAASASAFEARNL